MTNSRILVRDNQISVEFSHILTDGAGALQFLNSMLSLYSEACENSITTAFSKLHPEKIPDEEEFEDAFDRYFEKKLPRISNGPKAFHLPYQKDQISLFGEILIFLMHYFGHFEEPVGIHFLKFVTGTQLANTGFK